MDSNFKKGLYLANEHCYYGIYERSTNIHNHLRSNTINLPIYHPEKCSVGIHCTVFKIIKLTTLGGGVEVKGDCLGYD